MARRRRIQTNEFPIHVTARHNNREAFPLPLGVMWEILCDYLFLAQAEFGLQLLAFVLMPNHFHLLLRDPKLRLSNAMNHFMRESSREVGRLTGRINVHWGGPHTQSVVQAPLAFFHVYKYIYRNPVKARLCSSAIDWPFSSLRILLGQQKGILPLAPDDILFTDPKSVLHWIDQPFETAQELSIQRALRKTEFNLCHDSGSRNPSSLADWSCVPFDPENYRK